MRKVQPMSLILRTELTRALTHEELDGNFKFVYVKPWDYNDYQMNQLVYVKYTEITTIIYRCAVPHNRYEYDKVGGGFAIVIDGVAYWEAISGGGAYEPKLPLDMEVPYSVGGISAGTTVAQLKGKTFTDMWNKLLFPAISPSFVNPSISLTSSVTGLQTIGDVKNLTASATLNKGAILQPWDGNSFQDFRSGAPMWYSFYLDGVEMPNALQTSADNAVQNNVTITKGNHTVLLNVRLAQGPQPVDNYNEPSGSLYPETTLSTSKTYEGVYPLFATTTTTSSVNQLSLYSMISGNNIEITLAPEVDANRQRFYIPKVWVDSRPLTAVYYYNTVSNSYSNVNKISEFTRTTYTRVVMANNVDYYRYDYNALMRGEMKIKLVF